MTENSGVTQETRNPDGTFVKGQSGNPAGPGKGYKHMTTKLREAIEAVSEDGGKPEDQQLVRALVKKAKEGDVAAMKLIFNYLDGMPPQSLELAGKEGRPITIQLVQYANPSQVQPS